MTDQAEILRQLAAHEGNFAVLDSKDNLWIGDEAGPRRFPTLELAQVAARIWDYQLGFAPGRCRGLPYPGDATILRDEIPVPLPGVEAAVKILEQLERGARI